MAITKEEIQSKCSAELIASRDCEAIAEIVSIGRTSYNTREIGNGTILDTIGLVAGNSLLDVLQTDPLFRYVKPLLEQGRMVVGSPLVQATLQSLVPKVITQEQADKLAALGKQDNPCTPQEIAEALYNPDGSFK